MPSFFWAVGAVIVAFGVGVWLGKSEGYWSAIGRPIPMKEFRAQFRGYFVPLFEAGSPWNDMAVVVDKTEKNGRLFVATEPGYCFPEKIDINRDWRGRQIAQV